MFIIFCKRQSISIDKISLTTYIIISRCISALPKGRVSASENVLSELLLALIKKFNSERFAALECDRNEGAEFSSAPCFVWYTGAIALVLCDWSGFVDNIRLYEIDAEYVDYLLLTAPHLFRNKKPGQHNERKYIGVVLEINGFKYFAPLSSFKDKHRHMQESLDFLKIRHYAVINLNKMVPVPSGVYIYIDISKEPNAKYRALLLSEYRYIKSIQDKIRKNAITLYNHKKQKGNSTSLAKRCNDFDILEEACRNYKLQ